jgi:hypothetical protein
MLEKFMSAVEAGMIPVRLEAFRAAIAIEHVPVTINDSNSCGTELAHI